MASREGPDPYVVLGVSRQASGDEIARAFRRGARASHPDTGGTGAADRFQAVTDAYELLRDPRRRAVYDRSHPLPWPPTADARGASVRYAAPGSQHLVLGQPAPSEPMVVGRPRGDVEELVRIALSWLRVNW